MRRGAIVVAIGVLACLPQAASALPRLPRGLPRTFQIGADRAPGSAAQSKSIGLGMRDLYLPGPVNGPGQYEGWQKYAPRGGYLTSFVRETLAAGQVPVLTYYAILQSLPGGGSGEQGAVKRNLANRSTMTAYWKNVSLMLKLAGRFHRTVIVHVEPDQWGYLQQESRADNPKTLKVQVASTGLRELRGLPNDARGYAQAFVRLRNRYARNVLLGWHISQFGAGHDIATENLGGSTIDGIARRLSTFYKRLHAHFDLLVSYMGDRDAGEAVSEGNSRYPWDPSDYERDLHFIRSAIADFHLRAFYFQIPYGNTQMQAMNNTPFHWQDNHVETLLGGSGFPLIHQYAQAGVTGFLFGLGQATSTCPCDQATSDHPADGVTDFGPINGNARPSLSADDDGGFFKERVRAYRDSGPVRLP
jgi:hypothetical protein